MKLKGRKGDVKEYREEKTEEIRDRKKKKEVRKELSKKCMRG